MITRTRTQCRLYQAEPLRLAAISCAEYTEMKLWLRATFEQERRNPYGLELPLNVEEESTEFKLWLTAAEQEDTG